MRRGGSGWGSVVMMVLVVVAVVAVGPCWCRFGGGGAGPKRKIRPLVHL